MDWNIHQRFFIGFTKFQGRIRSLSGSASRFRRKGIAALLATLAVILGLHAQKISHLAAAAEWESEHQPTERIWDYALRNIGLHRVQDAKFLGRAVRTLPISFDDKHSVWTSPEAPWIAVFTDRKAEKEPLIYSYYDFGASSHRLPPQNVAFPKAWQPVGEGWSGFEKGLQQLESQVKALQKTVPPKRRAEFNDPRAIQY